MRVFAKPMSLDRLSLEARVLYTSFSLFLLIGIASSAWLYHDDGLGLASTDVVRYYQGDPPEAAPPSGELRFEKSARQVMETFHFHLFSVPVCLLIVGHLFMMCSLSTKRKVALLALTAAATLLHLLGPLLVRFASTAFAPVFTASAMAMGALWTLLLAWPVVEMWRAPREPRE